MLHGHRSKHLKVLQGPRMAFKNLQAFRRGFAGWENLQAFRRGFAGWENLQAFRRGFAGWETLKCFENGFRHEGRKAQRNTKEEKKLWLCVSHYVFRFSDFHSGWSLFRRRRTRPAVVNPHQSHIVSTHVVGADTDH